MIFGPNGQPMGVGNQPFNPAMGMGMGQSGNWIQDAWAMMMIEDRMDERRAKRHDRMMGDYMGMNFQKMMDGGGNNSQFNPAMMAMSGMGLEQIFDEDGKLKGVRYLPGQGNKSDNTILTTFMNNTQSLLNTLITNNGQGGGQWEKIFQYLLQREDSKNDPIKFWQMMKEAKEIMGTGSKTIDEVKLLLDAKLGLKHEEREDLKLKHELDMQMLEKKDQTDMMKQYLQTIMGLKDEILPFIGAFLKGGQANRIGLQKQQMPNPYGAQQAAYQARAYQQAAGGMNPQQYEYQAPPPAQEQQPQGLYPPQDVQFHQLSPEQLMEVRNAAIAKMTEINDNIIGAIDQEFQHRQQVVQRIEQRHAQEQPQEQDLEFNPTRKDEPQNKGIYVPMNNEQPELSHGVTMAYDPEKDEPKAFNVTEDFQ